MGSVTVDRYARQIALPEVGAEGQRRLSNASILVVGAGGLGSAALPPLCAAGAGRLILVDPDRIEEHNLHRQPIYRMDQVGQRKVSAAREALLALNPGVRIDAVSERLTPQNVSSLVSEADIVLDAADNFAATYTLNDECVRRGRPFISASVIGLSGFVGAFCADAPSYRAVFPEPPMQAGTCATTGVLGTAVGVMGTLQAQMTLSWILRLDPHVCGQLITVDFRTLRFSGFSFRSAKEEGEGFGFVAASDVSPQDLTVELRSPQEAPVPAFASSIRADVESIETVLRKVAPGGRVVLCCRTGLRAWRAGARLRAAGFERIALLATGE